MHGGDADDSRTWVLSEYLLDLVVSIRRETDGERQSAIWNKNDFE